MQRPHILQTRPPLFAANSGTRPASCAENQDIVELKGRRNPFVAREGMPFLLLSVAIAAIGWRLAGPAYAVPALILFGWLFFIFRDPHRIIPAVPLGVVSPVDGVITDIGVSDRGIVNGEVHRIVIRVKSFGTYTARSPVEGKIKDLNCERPDGASTEEANGLWIETDEGDDIVLQFRGHRFGLAPRAMLGFGERVGQGQRCAYLRLTRYAELQLPLKSRVLVTAGQRVGAGTDVLARLPHP